jgi:hypothetical protein
VITCVPTVKQAVAAAAGVAVASEVASTVGPIIDAAKKPAELLKDVAKHFG